MENLNQSSLNPPPASASGAFGHAWDVLKANFLELLLLTFIVVLVEIPQGWLNRESIWLGEFDGYDVRFTDSLYSLLYSLLVATPIEFGVAFMFLKSVRGQKFEFREVLSPFNRFVDVVLSRVLVYGIVALGIVMLIIPGIIFAIKLAFVPYLVMDKNMSAIDAVKESWRMTSGYGWTIFGMAILSFFIIVAGLIAFGVGIIISLMWISAAFAAIYYAVDSIESSNSFEPETSE